MAKTKAKVAAKAKPKTKTAKPKSAPSDEPSGEAEAAAWVAARGLSTAGKARWNVTIALDVVDAPASEVYSGDASRFHLAIYRDEWGVMFIHKGKTSHIRRATETFVNGFDQHKLIKELPALAEVGTLVRALEAKHALAFKRPHANIRSNLAGAKAIVRDWLQDL